MTAIKASIKRHPVLAFYALTFAISWGAVLLVFGPGGLPAPSGQGPTIAVALLVGPSVAGMPLSLAGTAALTWILVWAAALWVVIAAVAMANRRQLARQPLRRRVA